MQTKPTEKIWSVACTQTLFFDFILLYQVPKVYKTMKISTMIFLFCHDTNIVLFLALMIHKEQMKDMQKKMCAIIITTGYVIFCILSGVLKFGLFFVCFVW